MSDLILAANTWTSNAELIADVARLGYLRREWAILDPTYEQGTWWNLWRPDTLTMLHRETDRSDFRKTRFEDCMFDAVAYDPPYVCPGGLTTSNIKAMHTRYGMNSGGEMDESKRDFRTPAELQQIMDDGLTEMKRVVKPRSKDGGGYILMKCKSYVWSGTFWNGTYFSEKHAIERLGLEVIDRFEMVGKPGPQSQKRQVHARRNLSTLFVFRRGRY